MNIPEFLPVDWMEGMTGLADRSGPAFFAIFLMVVGVLLINGQSRRKHVAAYFSFGLAAVIIASITLISAANRTYRYDFRIFDAASHVNDVNQGFGYRIEASEQEDVWLKSRNNVNQFYLLALRNEKFQPGDKIEIVVRDKRSLELTVHSIAVCQGNQNPLYELRKIADAPEGSGDLAIVGQDDCSAPSVVTARLWGAAFAQDTVAKTRGLVLIEQFATAPVTLRYYEKPSDEGRVEDTIIDFSQDKAALRPYSSASKSPQQSNAVWYGEAVPIEMAGDLAIELIQNGVQLQYFGPYQDSRIRVNTVEVGYFAKEAAGTSLTVDDIKSILEEQQ